MKIITILVQILPRNWIVWRIVGQRYYRETRTNLRCATGRTDKTGGLRVTTLQDTL